MAHADTGAVVQAELAQHAHLTRLALVASLAHARALEANTFPRAAAEALSRSCSTVDALVTGLARAHSIMADAAPRARVGAHAVVDVVRAIFELEARVAAAHATDACAVARASVRAASNLAAAPAPSGLAVAVAAHAVAVPTAAVHAAT